MPFILNLVFIAVVIGGLIAFIWHEQRPHPLSAGTKWLRSIVGCFVALLVGFYALHKGVTSSPKYDPAGLDKEGDFLPLLFSLDRPSPTPVPAEFVPIAGSVYPGTEVFDSGGRYIGTITAVDPDYYDSSVQRKRRMTWLRYPDGHVESKDWDSLLTWAYRKNR